MDWRWLIPIRELLLRGCENIPLPHPKTGAALL